MKYILGTKDKMTQIFDEEGRVIPVTVLKTSPLTITQIKTLENDGYDAVQVGFGSKKEKNIAKPQQGQFKDMGNFAHVRENRVSEEEVGEIKVGDTIDIDVFAEGDKVSAQSVSKGKGFQGVVKRHGFHGGPRTHGQKHNERTGGSIGAGGLQRVIKGMKMPGRTGGETVTQKGLTVVKIDAENGQLYIKGAVPGRRGALIEVVGN